MTATKRRTKGAGSVDQLPSKRWRARFTGPEPERVTSIKTFDSQRTANAWLVAQARDVGLGLWQPPEKKVATRDLRAYAETWLADRDLKPRTRYQYQSLLNDCILPSLGHLALAQITVKRVRTWHASLNADTPTWRAQAYSLLRGILTTAYSEELVEANPCRIRGAGSSKKKHRTRPATLPELEVIVEASPPRYRAMILLAAWCALRFGELTELRRSDITLDVNARTGLLRVERGVVRVHGEVIVGDPKSDAGKRTVAVPPHLVAVLAAHLDEHVNPSPDALLFPAKHGGHMAPSALYTVFYPAREKAGRDDLRFHDLRHTGATLAAATGATLAELMARLGHSTPGAALVYQHASADRDQAIAAALSELVEAKVVPLRRVK